MPVSADGLGIVFGCLTIKLNFSQRQRPASAHRELRTATKSVIYNWLVSHVRTLLHVVVQTQTNLLDAVVEMNTRQTSVERRADHIEDSLRCLQVRVGPS